jgi:hypothetical protein
VDSLASEPSPDDQPTAVHGQNVVVTPGNIGLGLTVSSAVAVAQVHSDRPGSSARTKKNRAHGGGRQKGWRKGRVWSRGAVIDWKGDCDLDGEPATLSALAEAFGVKSPQTVRRRLRELDPPLPWPPEQHPDAWDPYPDPDDE